LEDADRKFVWKSNLRKSDAKNGKELRKNDAEVALSVVRAAQVELKRPKMARKWPNWILGGRKSCEIGPNRVKKAQDGF